ncbi:MAG: protein kinase [Phycisphaerales bacterium]|nr:protein kinase [Phycisphaerales bacterium]
MSGPERFRRVESLFRAALALPADSRDEFLTRSCGGETSILLQVRALLATDNRPDGALDRPAIVSVSGALEASSAPQLPQRIGRYQIIRKIGEGGMGTVFEAVQENPHRRVALKLLRHMDGSRRLLQRFQLEAQILGRLQHPGIAQVYEAGIDHEDPIGRPFFAMEFVDGPTLLEFAAQVRLDLRARLDLFVQICEAVQFAHQHGVIHRDLKPANILVVCAGTSAPATEPHLRDSRSVHARPHPKILDFGVARLSDREPGSPTVHTSVGELIGTVPYMSPEQAAGDPRLLDWRSDVYSLGVILYELLTGRLPHDVRQLPVHAAVRVIREDDPAPAGSVIRSLRGDIETILAKALEKDKLRRYQSAAELSSDLNLYLNQQPIHARPASALYRIGKFARRNKAIVGGVLGAFLALTAGTAIAVRQAIIAEESRAGEQRQRVEAERQSYRASLVAASASLRRHEIAEARRHLLAAPEESRGWEWAHLHSRLDDSLLSRTTGFVSMSTDISPDGRLVAACNSAGLIRLWRTSDWAPVAEHCLTGSLAQRRVQQLVFSADGGEIRAHAREGSVRLDGRTLAPITVEERVSLRRSPDGALAVALERTEAEDRLVLEDYATGTPRFRIDGRGARDAIVRFSADGSLVAIRLVRDHGLRVYRCSDGTLLCARPDLAASNDLCFNADGTRIGVALMTGEAQIVDTDGGATLATLAGHETPVVAIRFNPRGDRLATASDNGTVRLWDGATGALLAAMDGNPAVVSGLLFAPDGKTIITTTIDGDIRWWSADLESDPVVLHAPDAVYSLAFSPDGSQLAAACLGGERPLRVWDSAGWRLRRAALDGFLSAVAYSPDGLRLVVARSLEKRTSIVSLDGEEIGSIPGHNWRTDWAAFDADGRRILSLGNDGCLAATSLATGNRTHDAIFKGDLDGDGCRAALNPDRSLLAVACRTTIRLVDPDTLQTRATLEGHTDPIHAVAFSADGTQIVSGGRDRTVRVWNVRDRSTVATLTGHTHDIFAAIFSPDGRRIVSGGRDKVIRVWDTSGFREITQLHGHTSYVYCLAFSPDGRTLASGGGDSTVRIWDVRPFREVAASAHAGDAQ